ncbi:hypothetical protein FDUTEX481_07672 [Tolypothrix sp. PCC 7601]|nr:hypothetical protein FDUTEX481_07672 [Tolypothrix sp. PCC 7601]
MLINYTVIQNFDSSEFQDNGQYRIKPDCQTASPVGNQLS